MLSNSYHFTTPSSAKVCFISALMAEDKRQIKIEFSFTKEIFRESYRNLFDDKVKPRNFIWFGVVLIAYFVYNFYTTGFHKDDLWFYLPLLGIPAGLWFAKFFLPRRWGDKTFKQYEGKKYTWLINNEGIQINSDKSKVNLPWSNFSKATIGTHVIYLETADGKRTPIPVSAFSQSQLELFKDWIYEIVKG